MKKILDGLRAALMLAGIGLLAALTSATLELKKSALEVRQDAAQSKVSLAALSKKAAAGLDAITVIEDRTAKTELELAGMLNAQRHAVANEQKALNDFDGLLVETRKNLNTTFQQVGGAVGAVTDGVTNDSKALSSSLADITKQVGDQVSNPAIAESLLDIRDSAASLKVSAAKIAEASVDGAATLKDVHKLADYETKKVMAPVGWAKRAAYFAATLAGKVLNGVF